MVSYHIQAEILIAALTQAYVHPDLPFAGYKGAQVAVIVIRQSSFYSLLTTGPPMMQGIGGRDLRIAFVY